MSQELDKSEKDKSENEQEANKKLDEYLTVKLYRHACPPTITLGEYQQGWLAAAEATAVQTHVAGCHSCQAELEQIGAFLMSDPFIELKKPVADEEAAAAQWQERGALAWQQIKESGTVIIRLLADAMDTAQANLQQTLQPPSPLDALRGGNRKEGLQQRLIEAGLIDAVEDFETVIIIDTDWKNPKQCAIRVKVDIPSRGFPHLGDTEVVLKQEDTILETRLTNNFGMTTFENIETALVTQLTFEITPGPMGG